MNLGEQILQSLYELADDDYLKVLAATRDIDHNIQKIVADGGGIEDIKEYIAVSSEYLYTWSNVEINFNKEGYLFVNLYWRDHRCATIVVKSITGEPPDEVDWIKEGF